MTYNPPSVSNETTVSNGRVYAVEQFSDHDPGLRVNVTTGNGDDGIGVAQWWSTPLELTFKANALLTVSGEKVSAAAELIGLDGVGTPVSGNGDSLLNSDQFVIIPDLFSGEFLNLPDQEFVITTGAPAADQVFQIKALAPTPDQTFAVSVFAAEPDQTFEILAITTREIAVAEPPFLVTVGPDVPDQIFDVYASATPPDQTFTVTRGPDAPDVTLGITVIDTFGVTVSWAVPDQIFSVEVGPNPPATPDQIFGVSVGGPGAPPIPDPDQTFVVTTGADIPDQTFSIAAIDQKFEVTTGPSPFVVTVGPTPPDQIFDVYVSAFDPDQTFNVTVGADIPDQTFSVETITDLEVRVADAPVFYTVSNSGSTAYSFNGEGVFGALNPSISVTFDQLLGLQINATGHPFFICDTQTTGGCASDPAWANQLDNQGTTSAQVRVRFNTAGTYFYNCSIHAAMSGRIVVPSAVQSYDVQNSGASAYEFTGEGLTAAANPTINIGTGERLDLNVSSTNHPLWIKDTQTTGAGNVTEAWAEHLRGNGAETGTIQVVFNTPGTYFYICEFHSAMSGQIVVS